MRIESKPSVFKKSRPCYPLKLVREMAQEGRIAVGRGAELGASGFTVAGALALLLELRKEDFIEANQSPYQRSKGRDAYARRLHEGLKATLTFEVCGRKVLLLTSLRVGKHTDEKE
jgi:hypothetical protein